VEFQQDFAKHLKKAKESLENLSSCGKRLVKFTENPRNSSGNPRKFSGNLRKSTGKPRKSSGNLLEIRGCPVELQAIRGNPRKSWISWQSCVQILAELLPIKACVSFGGTIRLQYKKAYFKSTCNLIKVLFFPINL